MPQADEVATKITAMLTATTVLISYLLTLVSVVSLARPALSAILRLRCGAYVVT